MINKLKNYRLKNKESFESASKKIGCSTVALFYWETSRRIPSPKFMKKIVEWSNGEVQPNDFYTK